MIDRYFIGESHKSTYKSIKEDIIHSTTLWKETKNSKVDTIKAFLAIVDQKELKGCVIQRFPENDWKDTPCPQGLEHFCQPAGWYSTLKNKPPTYCVSILTDMEGKPSYLACLTFHESVEQERCTPNGDVRNSSDVTQQNILNDENEKTIYFVPKCLCLISRHRYYDTLKNCLTTIFVGYLNNSTELLEKMVGCMLGFVHVPPPGGPKLTFSIGGGDSQVLQPPLSAALPSTHESVAVLFNQLGINSMMNVFTALVTETKILLLSSSYTHLVMAAEALVALLYPLQFNYVFIPVLPSSLIDFLSAPTPFLMGVHTSYEDLCPELFDVMIVNIDEGYVTIPDSVHLSSIPEPYYTQVLKSLKMILTPSLFTSDLLFPKPEAPPSLALQDKELRAVFIKLFAQMFCGYRSCLTLIRVHPQPVISFNKLAFMEKRGFIGDEFFSKILDSVSFSAMTQARGPPYRVVDMFDELIAQVKPLDQENESGGIILDDLIPIVDHLCQNEPMFDNPEASTVPDVNQEVFMKPLKTFPLLNEIKINSYLSKTNGDETRNQGKVFQPPVIEPKQVPISVFDHHTSHYINQRRLEVLQDCIQYIYESKISEARKALQSVLRALNGKGARYALCNELEARIKNENAMLDDSQYNLITQLINAALSDDNTVSSNNIAVKIIPLVSAFHRKLGPSVVQFAYTSVQEHPVWSNIQFWEEAFYSDAQREIVELHLKQRRKNKAEVTKNSEVEKVQEKEDTAHELIKKTVSETEVEAIKKFAEKTMLNPSELKSSGSRNSMLITPNTPVPRGRTQTRGSISVANSPPASDGSPSKDSLKELPDAMKLAADLLGEWHEKSEEERQQLIYEEESILYSLTMLFAQRMMYLRVPVSACIEMRKLRALKRQQQERMRQLNSNNENSGTPTDDTSSLSIKPPSSVINDAASTYMGESVMMEGSSSGWGSQHDLADGSVDFGESIKDSTSKFILRFVERVCIEANVTPAHLKNLQQNIPMLVGMHIESLEEVYNETKDAPKQKAKILKPALLPGEKPLFDGLRCRLVADGRELGVRSTEYSLVSVENAEDAVNIGADIGGPCLLPAEGALFLTNYRVIFKGTPVDQFASEMTITRSFPVGGLLKEQRKKGALGEEYLQLRASTVQMLKLEFDEEVLLETIENFRRSLRSSRWPPSVYNTFAFNYKAPPVLQRTLTQKQQSIKKTHRTLSNVVNVKKKSVQQGSIRNKHKSAQSDDSTKRKYEAVNKDIVTSEDDDDDDMRQVRLEQQNRGADQLRESAICKDYERVGLGGLTNVSSSNSPWRISMVNFHYHACRSYPAILVVPHHIADDTVMKIAKNYRLNRFPVAVWRHRKTKGALLRSGGYNKTVLTALVKSGVSNRDAYQNLNLSDDEKFFAAIVKETHLYTLKGKHQTVSAGAALSMKAMSDDIGSLTETAESLKQMELAEMKNWLPANLYVFTDKSSSRTTKIESTNKIVVVNVEMHDVAQVKPSFHKLVKACCPNSPSDEKNFFRLIEESKWMSQISLLLQVSCSIVNLIDVQGSSCLISFGDGTEVTSQVASLVQIMCDPFYRTIDGFKALIEKDWLAFGYRFSHRGNHVAPNQATIAPFFLQFLDCVHQIVLQYPHAFEFNNYFLKFIAYHQTSMRFNTFFLDSEYERYQNGWFPESNGIGSQAGLTVDASLKRTSKTKKDSASSMKAEQLAQQQEEQKKKKSTSVSLWDYLNLQSSKYTLFQSFSYHENLSKSVLQPFCNVSNLEIWDYYTSENLYTGPTYDLELISDFEMANPSNEASNLSANVDVDREDSQRCLTGCYGNTGDFPRDEATYLLYELSRLKDELDQKTSRWGVMWDCLDVKDVLKKQHRTTHNWKAYWAKERRIALHKRTTIDMVLKGKVTDNSQVRSEFGFDHPHDFTFHNYFKSSICNYCLQAIATFQSALQCSQCGYNVHEKCQSMVPAQCPKHANLVDQPAQQLSRSTHSVSGTQMNPRNFKGTLYKRGHLLRQWKARWFVLDAERNHLTYYDSEEDTQLQGYIDLGDMRVCRLVIAPPHAPKWGDPRAFFEIETTKRVYYLLARQPDTAQEWVERLNALNV